MSNFFYFVRDRISVEDMRGYAETFGFQFETAGVQHALIMLDVKGMPKAIAYMNAVDNLIDGYVSNKKKGDFDLISFFQDELKIPVVTGTSKFAEQVLSYRRLGLEISEGRDDNLTDIAFGELEEFVQDFKGTKTTATASGKRIVKNQERKKPL